MSLGVLTALLAAPVSVVPTSAGLAAPKVAGTLILAPTTGAPGIVVKVTGKIPPQVRHRVKLQRLDAGTYATLTIKRTDRKGRFGFRTALPADRSNASYRVLSPRTLDPKTGERRSYLTPVRTAIIALPTPTPTATPVPPTPVPPTPSPTTPQPPLPAGPLERLTQGFDAAIAAGGGHIVYLSPNFDVFVWDLATDTNGPVTPGASTNLGSYWPSISADGRYAAYHSYKPNLVAGDTNQTVDVFTTDRVTGTTLRIGDGDSYPAISEDGRFVVYGLAQVSSWDRTTGTSIQVTNGQGPRVAVSGNGRYVAYQSCHHPDH